VEFETSYRRHLAVEQRRAVLEALAERLGPSVTMGDVLDAAEGLGWGDGIGDLTLADLAAALLEPTTNVPAPAAIVAQPEDDDEEEEEEEEEEAAPKAAPKATAAASANAKKKSRARAPEPEPPPPPAKGKKAGKPMMKTKTSRLKALRAKFDADEPMSLEEAAELLVPVIEELGQATMQDLEAFTGIGRRKLRFHIGQLVRHDHLERHGMGRGTYYTPVE
jgi:hypothetical protein